MEILHALESIRCPFLDAVMYGITQLGGEAVFMAVAIVVFWCIDKNKGYFILTVGFLSTIASQFLKLVFRVPRPWVRDPEFTIVEAARADAGGYSFPSGHTQNAVSTFGGIFTFAKRRATKAICIAIIVLVAFSRMYLGVHTLSDVTVALILGVIILFAVYPLFKSHGTNPKFIYGVLIGTILISAAYTAFTELYPWPADMDGQNLYEGIKNGYTLLGACCGMLLSYFLDRKYINFKTGAPLPAQILKCVLGLVIVVGLKEILKAPLGYLFFGHQAAHAVRYFIVVLTATCVWPITFPWFTRLFSKGKP